MTRAARSLALAVAFAFAIATHERDVRAEADLVPGQWVAFTAPRARGASAADTRLVVFVPERKPEAGERIPAPGSAIPELRCGGAWQIAAARPKKGAAANHAGAWAPSPSGDGRWVWHPRGRASTAPVAPATMPDAAADYGDEFYFCANAPGESPWAKVPKGKTLPGSWVTLVDGHHATTLFVANTSATDDDAVPELPQKARRIRCAAKLHPIAPSVGKHGAVGAATRPRPPFGRWVPDPFGSRRWAWVPSAQAPFGLRTTASPPNEPEPLAKACSWFDDAD